MSEQMSALEWAEKEAQLESGLKTAKVADLKAARKALSDHIAMGANPCPECNQLPHGMRKNPATYEVGCITCPKPKRARGNSAQAAVIRWNRGEYVVDFR